MTTDRRVSTSPVSPESASAALPRPAAAPPWWFVPSVFAALWLGWAWVDANWAIAVYGLSFWHYCLYGLAYIFGAVAPHEFRRDAVLWKSIALVALGSVYFLAPLDVLSLSVVAAGFLLNSLAAKALGTERTYYGYELADLPLVRITAFPYSWIAHPMLVGNLAAYSGTLLNADFRRQWWPLAVAHVALNFGLLLMELTVTPQRRNVRGELVQAGPGGTLRSNDYLLAALAATFAGLVAQTCESPRPLLGAAAAASISIYALRLFRRYTTGPVAPFERQERQAQATLLETIE